MYISGKLIRSVTFSVKYQRYWLNRLDPSIPPMHLWVLHEKVKQKFEKNALIIPLA